MKAFQEVLRKRQLKTGAQSAGDVHQTEGTSEEIRSLSPKGQLGVDPGDQGDATADNAFDQREAPLELPSNPPSAEEPTDWMDAEAGVVEGPERSGPEGGTFVKAAGGQQQVSGDKVAGASSEKLDEVAGDKGFGFDPADAEGEVIQWDLEGPEDEVGERQGWEVGEGGQARGGGETGQARGGGGTGQGQAVAERVVERVKGGGREPTSPTFAFDFAPPGAGAGKQGVAGGAGGDVTGGGSGEEQPTSEILAAPPAGPSDPPPPLPPPAALPPVTATATPDTSLEEGSDRKWGGQEKTSGVQGLPPTPGATKTAMEHPPPQGAVPGSQAGKPLPAQEPSGKSRASTQVASPQSPLRHHGRQQVGTRPHRRPNPLAALVESVWGRDGDEKQTPLRALVAWVRRQHVVSQAGLAVRAWRGPGKDGQGPKRAALENVSWRPDKPTKADLKQDKHGGGKVQNGAPQLADLDPWGLPKMATEALGVPPAGTTSRYSSAGTAGAAGARARAASGSSRSTTIVSTCDVSSPSLPGTNLLYTVQEGQCVWGIIRDVFGNATACTVDNVLKLNNLTLEASRHIPAGTELVIGKGYIRKSNYPTGIPQG
eukprot:jgi/Mesvir1/7453/Mv19228-RA.1